MPTEPTRSLTPTEHSARVRFDAARNATDGRREKFWKELTDARTRGAVLVGAPVVRVRLRENYERMASALIDDLLNREWVAWPNHPDNGIKPTVVGADLWCDLIFDTTLPPCERESPCPHAVAVYVLEADNDATATARLALRNLQDTLGPQPPLKRPQ
jgi:hypothetical protein